MAATQSILILHSKAIESHVISHGLKHLEKDGATRELRGEEAHLKHGEKGSQKGSPCRWLDLAMAGHEMVR